MGKYEVTQAQWQAVMGTTVRQQRDKADPSYSMAGEGENYPMYYVSWNEAQEFVRRLNSMQSRYTYRLPTEAEWEYAARAGTTGRYAGNLHAMAWYGANSGGKSHPVGTKQPNRWGLYDMHGNVYEWCEDSYHKNYNGAPKDGSAWLSGGDQRLRMLRGGMWHYVDYVLRSADRVGTWPNNRSEYGVRVVAVARNQ
jgi:formylglycine-generating enzyme required for sulfatase activity